MLKSLLGGIAVAMTMVASANADEVYAAYVQGSNEALPDIVYEVDNGNQAVWIMQSQNGSVRFYIDGLGGVFNNRQSYSGYLVVYSAMNGDSTPCPEGPATDHLGRQVALWGRLSISWSNDSNFVMMTSRCNQAFGSLDTIVGRNRYQ